MKIQNLAISLPLSRSIAQEAALDAVLADPRRLSFFRTVDNQEDPGNAVEHYLVRYCLPDDQP